MKIKREYILPVAIYYDEDLFPSKMTICGKEIHHTVMDAIQKYLARECKVSLIQEAYDEAAERRRTYDEEKAIESYEWLQGR